MKHKHRFLYALQCIIVLPAFSVIWHEQYTCTCKDFYFLSSSLCSWEGRERYCTSKQCVKCFHIYGCSKWNPPGWLLLICQCSSKCSCKDTTVCGATLHLGVHVVDTNGSIKMLGLILSCTVQTKEFRQVLNTGHGSWMMVSTVG